MKNRLLLSALLCMFCIRGFAYTVIPGATSICIGSTVTETVFGPYGTWSSSNPAVATIGIASGVVTGVSAGTAVISYKGDRNGVSFIVTVDQCCLGNSLVINTGYDPATLAAITPIVDLAAAASANLDPHWKVTGISAAAYSGISYTMGTPVTIGDSAVSVNTVTASPAWAAFPGTTGETGTWINCLNASYYHTDASGGPYGTDSYYETFSRTFKLCSDDDINIDIRIACDNYCLGISLDTGSYFYTQPSPGLPGSTSQTMFDTVPTYTPHLVAGTHTISVTVVNYENVIPTDMNYSGLGIIGKITSATGSNSIVQEWASCSAYACGAGNSTLAVAPTIAPITGNLVCFPNPNNGTFTLRGALQDATAGEAGIEVADMMGKVVYRDVADIENGGINKTITLSDNVANGLYLIKITSDNSSKVIRFSVNK